MFLALRDLRRGWRRFVLVGSVVALVAVLSGVLTGLADGLVQDGTSGLRALPFSQMAFAPHAQAVFSRSTLDSAALDAWRKAPGVHASPVGVSFVNAAPASPGAASLDLALFGVPADSFLVQRADARQALGGPPGLVLSSELAKKGAKVGDRYRLGGSDVVLPVLGFTFTGSYGHVPIAFTSLRTWQTMNFGNDARGRFSAIALRVPSGTDVAAVDARAQTQMMSKEQTYAGSPGYTAETATMQLIRGFLLVISAMVVGAFFTVLTVQRTRQIGLLKAMGASSGYVVRDGVSQMIVIVMCAVVAGTAVGAAIVAALQGGAVPVTLSLGNLASAGALLAFAGIVGSLVPFRRILKVEPIVALGMEG